VLGIASAVFLGWSPSELMSNIFLPYIYIYIERERERERDRKREREREREKRKLLWL
jgi:hypothetical protein